MFLLKRAYLCINCEKRFYEEEAKYIHKRNCICKECAESYKMYREDSTHYAGPNMEFYAPAFVYSKEFKKSFLKFKFQGYTSYGHILARLAADQVKQNPYFDDYKCLIPVPISKYRMNQRGFNQSELMVKYIAEAMNKPVYNCLRRIRHSTEQSKFPRLHLRIHNVRDAYNCEYEFKGENVILFDDVYTSGSTMYECAKVLKKQGAGKIAGIACAHSFYLEN